MRAVRGGGECPSSDLIALVTILIRATIVKKNIHKIHSAIVISDILFTLSIQIHELERRHNAQ